MSMFIPLPLAFNQGGKFNTAAIERYYKEETAAKASGRFRIVIDLLSNRSVAAEFDDEADRDSIYTQLDRLLTGKDKIPQYDALEE